jgi:hypothetical protein
VKAIADTMGVARSHLIERMKPQEKSFRARYHKADDAWLLPLIRELVDCRATYGYRRICALLNRKLDEMNKPGVNHKRVYRIMRQNGLLLARYTGKRPQLSHEGKVVTLRSNLRWCSDGFEIPCWNGQVVRVAFALDCCDREIISHVATTGGITGEMVRDLMIESIEQRLGVLTDSRTAWNGSVTMAAVTPPERRLLLHRIWASSAVLLPSEVSNPTAWPKPSSRPSSGIMSMSMIVPMPKPSCHSLTNGSRITMNIILTRGPR